MEFKIRTHKVIDNGYEISKVNGETPIALQGYYSEEKYAQIAIDDYMIKAIEKKEKLEKDIADEKKKIDTNAKKVVKKPATKKTTKK